MISLDQVYLLEQKVESAVEKIQQLQAENDALRSKCAELTNALSVKSEQLNTFETDQSQIEDGIKKALDRLSSIENSVLRTVSSMSQNGQVASSISTQNIQNPVQASVQPSQPVKVQAQPQVQVQQQAQVIAQPQAIQTPTPQPDPSLVSQPVENISQPAENASQVNENFSDFSPLSTETSDFVEASPEPIMQTNAPSFETMEQMPENEEIPTEEEDSQDDLGFDIF